LLYNRRWFFTFTVEKSLRQLLYNRRCSTCHPGGGKGEWLGIITTCPGGGKGEWLGIITTCPGGGKGEWLGIITRRCSTWITRFCTYVPLQRAGVRPTRKWLGKRFCTYVPCIRGKEPSTLAIYQILLCNSLHGLEWLDSLTLAERSTTRKR
jgi:hypothetical protein